MNGAAVWIFLLALCLAWWAGRQGPVAWVVERAVMEERQVEDAMAAGGGDAFLEREDSALWRLAGSAVEEEPPVERERVMVVEPGGGGTRHYVLTARPHRGAVSFLPAVAFAKWVTRRFVRGPRTAKLAAWGLGVAFFQGGSLSTLLVGATVKPIADAERVSHEEFSYVVDSTSSPVAILLPFNAWPFYVQGLIFVSGVGALATEAGRVVFFLSAVPLSFYAMLAVGFTFLLSLDRLPFIGRVFRDAIRRARETGELDREGARPMRSRATGADAVEPGYRAAAWEFPLPMVCMAGVAAGMFALAGTPAPAWAFGAGVLAACGVSVARGLSWGGVASGGVAGIGMVGYAAAVLVLAVAIGAISQATGGGVFLIELLDGRAAPLWLPMWLFLASGAIALATGSSWGTFAVVFPLAMPLAWAVAEAEGNELGQPLFFLKICFAAVLNGGVFGDHCSPISDTSVLSSLATGCDLMDHIRTQMVPSLVAGGLAVCGWTLLVWAAA